MKELSNNIKVIFGCLEAPIIFSLVLVFIQGLLEMFEVSSFLFLDRNELVFIISYLVLFIYFFPIYKKLSTNKKKVNIKFDKSKIFKCFILGGLFSIIFNIAMQYIINTILKHNIATTIDDMRFSIIYLFIVCILGPCIEELCYRGIVLRKLERFYKSEIIVIISSIVFSLGHASSFGNVLYAFVLGIFMMLIFIKNKRLIFSIFFHIGANVTSVLTSLLLIPSISNVYVYLPILLLTIIICIFMLIKNKKLFL